MKKLFVVLAILFFLTGFGREVLAGNEINIYFFWGDGCPHCAKEEKFLEKLEDKYPEIRIYDYEIYNSQENQILYQKAVETLMARGGGIPFTVVGNKRFIGFTEGATDKEIESQVIYCINNKYNDSLANVLGVPPAKIEDQNQPLPDNQRESKIINLPIIGEIDALSFSLPLLTVIIGVLDGFNPCAMWTLLFLISLLLGMQNKTRMWILGSSFIIASAAVYFLFMAAWLNLILFLGFIIWIRILIGLVALGAGGYNLKDFFTNKGDECKVTGTEKRQRVFARLKAITQQKSFWLALGGVILLAFAVNLVELICSAGLPAVYTQVLALSSLAKWQNYLYLLLYIFFFMLDDLLVFFAAMITLQMTGVTTRYTRASKLIGGILMLVIGLLLIFKPGWLMFG